MRKGDSNDSSDSSDSEGEEEGQPEEDDEEEEQPEEDEEEEEEDEDDGVRSRIDVLRAEIAESKRRLLSLQFQQSPMIQRLEKNRRDRLEAMERARSVSPSTFAAMAQDGEDEEADDAEMPSRRRRNRYFVVESDSSSASDSSCSSDSSSDSSSSDSRDGSDAEEEVETAVVRKETSIEFTPGGAVHLRFGEDDDGVPVVICKKVCSRWFAPTPRMFAYSLAALARSV